MARRRMIDPNFWGSPDVSKLSHFDRLVLIGLISNADDYGKGFSAPAYVRSTIFPYEDIQTKKITTALGNIQSYCEISFYEINGGQFYKFNNWGKWQSVDKPYPSKIPEPFATDSLLIPESIPTDSTLKEKKRKEEKRREDFFTNDSLNDAFNSFLEMRTSIKKPMTPRAIEMMISKLDTIAKNDEEKIAILNESVMNSWQGIFPLKNLPKENINHGYEDWSGTGRDRDAAD